MRHRQTDPRSAWFQRTPGRSTQSLYLIRADTVQTPARVPWSIVKPPRHLLRPVGLLLALCVLAGVLVAGMAFPGALAVGMVSNEAGDSVNSVSTDLATGQLPQTSTITDSAGVPIAYLFDQNRDPVAADRISPHRRPTRSTDATAAPIHLRRDGTPSRISLLLWRILGWLCGPPAAIT